MTEEVFFLSGNVHVKALFNLPATGVPCVIMSHGMDSTGEGDDYPIVADLLADKGIASLRITHPSRTEEDRFPKTGELYGKLLYRIQDINASVKFLEAKQVDMLRLGGIGTSFGGMVMLGAHEIKIGARVLIASPYTEMMIRDNEQSQSGKDQSAEGQKYDIATLVIHGDDDAVVPTQNAYKIFSTLQEPKRLEIISGADHVFSNNNMRRKVNQLCVDWMTLHLDVDSI